MNGGKQTLFGLLIGGLIGYAFTKMERRSSEDWHTIIGTAAGITIGGLLIHHVKAEKRE